MPDTRVVSTEVSKTTSGHLWEGLGPFAWAPGFLLPLGTLLPRPFCPPRRREGNPAGLGSIPGQQGCWAHPGPRGREAVFVVGPEWLASGQEACLLVRLMRPAAADSTEASRKHLRTRQSRARLRPEMSVLVCLSPVWPVEGQQQTGVWLKRGWRDLSPRAPAFAACAVQREPLSFRGLRSVLRFISPAAPFLLPVQPGNRCPSRCRAGQEPGLDPDPYPTLSVSSGKSRVPCQPLVCAEGAPSRRVVGLRSGGPFIQIIPRKPLHPGGCSMAQGLVSPETCTQIPASGCHCAEHTLAASPGPGL